MSTPKQESTLRVLVFAALVAMGCAMVLSATVHWLRPAQLDAGAGQYMRAVVSAAGLAPNGTDLPDEAIRELYMRFEFQILDLDTNRFTRDVDPSRFDYRQQFAAGQRSQPRYMPVYLLRDRRQIRLAVMPFYAQGMWSAIHGFIALSEDLSTIAGVSIYEHGETPGIGDRIQAPAWLAKWQGKRLYSDDGEYLFRISARPDDLTAPYTVDTITGATVTVSAVDEAMSRWFGDDGYAPILTRLRKDQ